MLGEILKTLELHKGELIQSVHDKVPNIVPNIVPHKIPNKVPNKLIESYPDVTASAWNVYALIKQDSRMTIAQMAEALSVKRPHDKEIPDGAERERIGGTHWKQQDWILANHENIASLPYALLQRSLTGGIYTASLCLRH